MDEKKRTELLAAIVGVENTARQIIETMESLKPKGKKPAKIDCCIPSENYHCRDFFQAFNDNIISFYPPSGKWMMYETVIDYCPWCGRDLED